MVCGFYVGCHIEALTSWREIGTAHTLKSTLKVRFSLVAMSGERTSFHYIIMAIKFVLADRAYT